MAKTRANLGDISEILEQQTQTFVVPQYIDVPNTEIVDRAQILDPTKDLGCRYGIERVSVTQIGEVGTEYDINGKEVWKDTNDPYDRARFVGGWRNVNSSNIGRAPFSSQVSTEDYLEIVFYGTGLNILVSVDPGFVRDYRATIDGGSEGSNFYPTSPSNLLSRFYRPLQILPVVSGLSQGIHTVKVREASTTGNIPFYGYEVINKTSTLQIAKGELLHRGKKSSHLSTETVDVDDTTPFDTGIQGTKGGLVQISLKPDGTIRRDLRAPEESSGTATTIASAANSFIMDATPPVGWIQGTVLELDDGTNREYVAISSIVGTTINLRGSELTVNSYTNAVVTLYGQAGSAVNRTNEEIWRIFWPREFGTYRPDDFINPGASNKNFTIDDCGTSLGYNEIAGGSTFVNALYGREGLSTSGIGDPVIYFDFYGTGISVLKSATASGGADTYDLIVDGKACASFPTAGDQHDKLFEIVSDLPLGWHQLAVRKISVATWDAIIENFVVYGPKAQDILNDEVPLSQYCLQGDYKIRTPLNNDSPTPAGPRNIARGVVRHTNTREFIYTDGTGGTANWAQGWGGADPTFWCSGFEAITDRNGASIEHTFFGKGFDLRYTPFTGRSTSVLVEVDTGSGYQILNSTNFPGVTPIAYGGGSFTFATGILNQFNAVVVYGAGFSVTGFPEQLYRVRFTNQTTSILQIECIDTIQTLYYPVQETHPTQNYSIIGSNSLRDLRKLEFDIVEPVNSLLISGQATVSTTNTVLEIVPNMNGGVYSHGSYWRISFSGQIGKSIASLGGGGYQFQLRCDGIPIVLMADDTHLANAFKTSTLAYQIYLSEGFHFFQVDWNSLTGNLLTCLGSSRILLLEEIR